MKIRYQTPNFYDRQAELDLLIIKDGKRMGFEFKYSDAPKKTKSMEAGLKDLDLTHLWIVYPGKQAYRINKTISVLPLRDIPETWNYTKY